MQKLTIHLVNWALLIIVLIGVPSITSKHFGGVGVSSISKTEFLSLWGLGLAAAGNLGFGLLGGLKRRERRLLLAWSMAFSSIFLVELLLFAGVIHFRWLKDLLLGIDEKVRGSR